MRAGGDETIVEDDRPAEPCREAFAAFFAVERDAAFIRVDKFQIVVGTRSEHEVAGKVDTGGFDAQSIGDGFEEDAKRDRHADATIDQVIQIAIAEIVIIGIGAFIAFFNIQNPVDLSERAERARAFGESVARAIGEIGDAREVSVDLEVGIGVARDLERRSRQIDAIDSGDEALEFRRFGVQKISSSAVPAFGIGPRDRLRRGFGGGFDRFLFGARFGPAVAERAFKNFPAAGSLIPFTHRLSVLSNM